MLTKLQLPNLPVLQLQNLEQTLCSESGQQFDFMTKLQLPNLHQTIVNTFLSINVSNSNNFNNLFTTVTTSTSFELTSFTCQGHQAY